MSQFTNKLINLRESHDWSKTYVANHLGLKNMQTYANWEYGKSEPDSEMLTKIARLYDVSVDYLVGNSDSKKPISNKEIDIDDFVKENGILTYEGMPIPQEDLEVLKRLMQSRKLEKEKDDEK